MKKLNGDDDDDSKEGDKVVVVAADKENDKKVPKLLSYEEINSEYGLIFNEGSMGDGEGKTKKRKKINPEICPVKAINRVSC